MKNLSEYLTEAMRESCHVSEGMFYKDLWKNEVSSDGKFTAQILAFEEPSEEYGIDGGKISKLLIRDAKNKEWLCNYDRGWDVKPKSKVKKFYDEILAKYN